MDYRIDPTPITPRSSRWVVAGTAAVVLVLGIAVAGLSLGGRDADVAAGPSSTPAASAPAVTSGPSPAPSPDTRCHDVAARRCALIARAALAAIADPTLPSASTVDVWASLVCDSVFDCPPPRMADRRAAGSAIIGLAHSLVLWVNVTEPAAGTVPFAPEPRLEAWVIRSGPG